MYHASFWQVFLICIEFVMRLFICGLQGHVVMGQQAVSPYQQVFEKTKALAYRSQVLVMKIENKLGAKANEVSWHMARPASLHSFIVLMCV